MVKKIFVLCLSIFLFPCVVLASSTVVMDVDSGRILYAKNKDSERLIASITKIMTCMVVLENASLDQKITVGDEVLSMYGTNIYLEVGEEISVLDLLYGMMLRSGNDAAMTLAVQTMGSEEAFVQKMNEKAREIGMSHTVFENPHGLDEKTKNYSTAYDMALLSQYAFQNEMYQKIVSTKKYSCQSSYKSYLWYNRMSLLNQYKYCVGGKNGYTPAAGKTLVSYAMKDQMTLTIVTLDDADLYEHHKKLYESFFEDYHRYTIVSKEEFIWEDKTYQIKENFSYPLKEEETSQIQTFLQIHSKDKKGESGSISIYLNQSKIGEVPLYEKIEKKKEDKTIFQKIQDYLFDNRKKLIEGLQNRRIPF